METKIRVLIADPNEDMRMLLKDMISREGDMTVCACLQRRMAQGNLPEILCRVLRR